MSVFQWDDFAFLLSLDSKCESFCLSGLFQGDIQQLLIVEDPQAAASYCVDYIPDCDSALPYNSHTLQPLEVSIATKRKQHLLEKPKLIYSRPLDTI